jgi:glutathione reductase (NADPH)
MYEYDLFTIGAGSGGVRASRMAAATGARVAVAESRDLGGTCVNVGCVPKKLFVYASHFAHDFADSAGFGWSREASSFDWATLLANKNAEIARLNGIYQRMLENAGVEIIKGHAEILDAHTVRVGENRYTAANILVATGSWPWMPDIPGIEHAISSNEAFHLETLPERAILVGGGYIAVEFAGIYHNLGVRTAQLYRGELFLRGFDDDLRIHLATEMRKAGIDLRFETNVTRIDKVGTSLIATLTDGSKLEAEQILFATGRVPLSKGIGLENAGVALNDKGAIIVDAYSGSNVPSIWAIGDVTNRINLTPVAIAEAMALVRTLFHNEPTAANHANVPSAVFSDPPIGTVGLTETEARASGCEVRIYRSEFRAMKHTLGGRDTRCLMKLVVDAASDRVLGAHMIGDAAGEIMQGIGIAITCGATKAQFDATIGIHPTSAEEFVTMRTPG